MSTSYKPPFVVVGTGRCGTVSITEIVGSCHNTYVTHEEHYIGWYDTMDPKVGELIRDARDHSKRGITRGYVGHMYLPHVPSIRSSIHDLRVIHLWREKEPTVESFLNFQHYIRPKDKRHWIDKCADLQSEQAKVAKCFPLIDACSVRQAFEFYWEMYDKMAREHLAQPVFRMHMNELNDTKRLHDLCDFLSISKEDRHFPEKRKYHTKEEVVTNPPEINLPVDRSIRHEVRG